MHNIFTIVKREYMERVRSRSFLITTILVPAVLAGILFLPTKIAAIRSGKPKHLVVVSADAQLAQFVSRSLSTPLHSTVPEAANEQTKRHGLDLDQVYAADASTDTSEHNREVLRQQVETGAVDGFIWMSNDATTTKKVTLVAKNTFMDKDSMRQQITRGIAESQLATRGITPEQSDELFAPVKIESVKVEAGAESKSNEGLIFATTLILVMLLYGTLLFYGITVMRAVLEEKNSRIMEVLLSTVTAKELMAGKILGVGAVGLTQVLIWMVTVAIYGGSAVAAVLSVSMPHGFRLPIGLLAAFGAFFLLGYVLYSTLYAAVGASINSEQEGQQLQMVFASPLIVAIAMLMPTIQAPTSGLVVALSLFPFTAPVIMYIRIALGAAPMWQIALSIAIMLGTMYLVLSLCSRVYRIGILMYGKRPTLPELMKWLKYAGA